MKKSFFVVLIILGTLINAQDTLEFTDLYGDYLGQPFRAILRLFSLPVLPLPR